MKLLLACVFIGCGYDAHLNECTILCSTDTGCPPGLTCGGEGLCRLRGATETCAPQFASCDGLAATCGPNGDDDCCASAAVPGGTFFRNYDTVNDGLCPFMNLPATISSFGLDKYEITVGRFREFVEAQHGTQQSPPPSGAGAHPRLAGSGWNASWNAFLTADAVALVASLKCNATGATWTDTPGANESLPMNCVTWYEAMAFCIWDGGSLPTYAEWNFAAAGGEEQRAYPWSSPPGSTTIDCSYANFAMSPNFCVNGTIGGTNRVGSESPKGDGRWGQSDIAGNVWEFTLDAGTPPTPCVDCAALPVAEPGFRIIVGGAFNIEATGLRICTGAGPSPIERNAAYGARCARPLP